MNHKIDKDKVRAGLEKRGWTVGIHKEWIAPINKQDSKSVEQDWVDSILEGIICHFEESVKATKKFIEDHPTPKRR